MTDNAVAEAPLSGVRVVEIASFVAVPLAGMTLAQLGAEVIRVDPVGGGADYRRWPLTAGGTSIYWTGLNKGVRSVAVDLRAADGQDLVRRLILGAGVLITNVVGRQWHSFETLVDERPDLVHLEVSGRADGSTGVDYTVNAAAGFPMVTGPPDHQAPINHALPAWDVACGLYAALGVVAALRRRDATGRGSQLTLALENVALATGGALGFLTEPMVNGTERERLGNSVYGQYGQTFRSSDGATFMIVALTARHFRDLAVLTGTLEAVAALEKALGVDFFDEGDRFRYRDALTGLFNVWFGGHTAEQISAALSETAILWERYRSFGEVAESARVTENPMFRPLTQPGLGEYRAAGLPLSFDGEHPAARPAPALGDDTRGVLADLLALPAEEIDRLIAAGTVAGGAG
ncbi:CoA transferase [Mycobacterium sp. 1274756.6]|uniref:CoA transferase n=1 Tax=Mycobacterium sp. 1274756.6 TaxID=1834076 RepID=UPI00080008BB|nr:CoA transferase [Mycobacterium sp. 1274756.6]OBJ67491.1 mesaconyl-CoA isomerase [Mycobacterium sp. 1274756.6]